MKTKRQTASAFTSLRRTAAHLGLPVAWLRREADAARLPCLRAGRRRMFDIDAVAAALAERQRAGAAGEHGGNGERGAAP